MRSATPLVKFTVGIEDKQPMIWQLAVLLESLRGQVPDGWEPFVVVCNDHRPVSAALARVLSTYGARYVCAPNYPRRESVDFISGSGPYAGLNKITALEAAAPYVKATDVVCLLDTDIFLYGDLNRDLFPTGDALCENWLIAKPRFYSGRDHVEGVDLKMLLSAMGTDRQFKGGGVLLFLTGKTLRNRAFVRDCFRFAQVMLLLGKIQNVLMPWQAEMPAYALALTTHGIDYEVIEHPQFSVENNRDPEVPSGSFYHYYGPEAFWGSSWGKYHFRNRDLLSADLARFKALAQSAHETYFFELAQAARDRLEGADASGLSGSGTQAADKRWQRGPITDSLRYFRFHVLKAMDPGAPTYRDLTLAFPLVLVYRVLAPVRALRRRLQMRRMRAAGEARAREAAR